jgi:hypothetical protein
MTSEVSEQPFSARRQTGCTHALQQTTQGWWMQHFVGLNRTSTLRLLARNHAFTERRLFASYAANILHVGEHVGLDRKTLA